VRVVRPVVGLAALVAACALLAFSAVEEPLVLAIALLGVTVLAHAGIDILWARVSRPATPELSSVDDEAPLMEGLRQLATLYVSTPGVILGLLTAFDATLTTTVKVGAISLATTVVTGMMLFGPLMAPISWKQYGALQMLAYLFNFAFLALAFGILCIALALAYA
jgi:hypothetical protein